MANQILESPVDVEFHIAPWALPNEDIPIQVSWGSSFKFNTARITIPNDFVFADFLNLEKVTVNGCQAEFIPKKEKSEQGFFGFVVRCLRIPNDTSYYDSVELVFDTDGVYTYKLSTRVFRPILECTNAPDKIELLDEKEAKLPIYLSYRGFGDIEVKITAKIGGTIVSEGSTVAREVLKRLWESETSEEKNRSTKEKVTNGKKQSLKIDQSYVEEVASQVKRMLETGEVPQEMFEKENVSEMKAWLASTRNRTDFMDMVYSRVEDVMISLIIDLVRRAPTSSVHLVDASPRIWADIKAPIVGLVLRLEYRDLIGNTYTPIEKKVNIVDSRVKGKATIGIPIVVQKWTEEALHNVAGL